MSAIATRDVEREVKGRRGVSVRFRPIRPDDARRLVRLCDRLSPATKYQRFFSIRTLRPEEAEALASVDAQRGLAIVAEVGDEVIGVARYMFSGDDVPDVGLVIEDAWQGSGLGPALFDELLRAGEARGVSRFRADVLADNRRMLHLLARSVEITERVLSQGVVSLVFRRRGGD